MSILRVLRDVVIVGGLYRQGRRFKGENEVLEGRRFREGRGFRKVRRFTDERSFRIFMGREGG